jgi:hypothetical protein
MNEDQNSRRKFLTQAGLVGAAAVVSTPAAANPGPPQTELSPEQISKLEEIVKNFITNAQAAKIQPLGSTLALMGHGSHNNEAAAPRAPRQQAPTLQKAPTRKKAPTTAPSLKKE